MAVMMHWGFDYFGYALYYFDQVRGLPPLTSEFTSLSSLQYMQFYSDLLVYMIGIAILFIVIYTLARELAARRKVAGSHAVVASQAA
jgi:hypothetical protein